MPKKADLRSNVPADPLQALAWVHQRLRCGNFQHDLLSAVRANLRHWQELPNLADRLKGVHAAAEVFDYLGHYDEAKNALAAEGPGQLEEATAVAESAPDDAYVFMRRIWVVLAYATTLYRDEHYDKALDQIEGCQKLIDQFREQAGEADAFLGTRSRLAYARGQIQRQLRNYDQARPDFEQAIVFARRRFVATTPFAEQSVILPPPLNQKQQEQFEAERALAQWTIGKCLALGLGWMDYTTGRLASSIVLLSAGYALLRGTGDVVHRAFATLLIGAAERARAGDDGVALRSAVAVLENGSHVLRAHPTFRLRAAYELALAYYQMPECRARALAEIKILKTGTQGTRRTRETNARWSSAVLTIESRMARLEGRLDEARTLANDAVDAAERAGRAHALLQAEALINCGDVSLSQSQAARERGDDRSARFFSQRAVSSLSDALARGGRNPKIAVVSRLHLTRAHQQNGDMLEAEHARAAATPLESAVEHGYIRALAARVDKELERDRYLFIDGRRVDVDLHKNRKTLELEVFLFKLARARSRNLDQTGDRLGLKPKGVRKLQARLRAAGLLPPARSKPRRSK